MTSGVSIRLVKGSAKVFNSWMGGRNKLGEMVEIKRRGFQLTATRSDSLYC